MTITIYSHLLHDTYLFQMDYSLINFLPYFLADISFSHYRCLNIVCTITSSKLTVYDIELLFFSFVLNI